MLELQGRGEQVRNTQMWNLGRQDVVLGSEDLPQVGLLPCCAQSFGPQDTWRPQKQFQKSSFTWNVFCFPEISHRSHNSSSPRWVIGARVPLVQKPKSTRNLQRSHLLFFPESPHFSEVWLYTGERNAAQEKVSLGRVWAGWGCCPHQPTTRWLCWWLGHTSMWLPTLRWP